MYISNKQYNQGNNCKLLRYNKPREDEYLTSYLMWLSKLNFCSLSEMIKFMNLHYEIRRDFVMYKCDENVRQALLTIPCLDRISIEKMFDTYLRCKFFRCDLITVTAFRIISKDYRLCPHCINEGIYERKHWKLSDIKMCLYHNVKLMESCPECGQKFSYKAAFQGKCQNCGFSIDKLKAIPVSDTKVIANQRRYYSIFEKDLSFKIQSVYERFKLTDEIYLVISRIFHSLVLSIYDELLDLQILPEFLNNNDKDLNCIIITETLLDDWLNGQTLLTKIFRQVKLATLVEISQASLLKLLLVSKELSSLCANPLVYLFADLFATNPSVASTVVRLFYHESEVQYIEEFYKTWVVDPKMVRKSTIPALMNLDYVKIATLLEQNSYNTINWNEFINLIAYLQ